MKYLETIEIKNFKSIRHQVIDGCKRINLFIGYPNVGKSNILEALSLFSFLEYRPGMDFSLSDICRMKDSVTELFFNRNLLEEIEVSLNGNLVMKGSTDDQSRLIYYFFKYFPNHPNQLQEYSNFRFDPTGKLYGHSNPVIPDYAEFVSPVKKYTFRPGIEAMDNTPKSLRVPYGSNLLSILQGNSELRVTVKRLFEEYGLKLVLNPSEKAINFLKELEDGTGVLIPYHQVADTLQRLIFYKAALMTNNQKILLFEEPEAHMYPSYIREFTGEILNDKGENQYFIATHSPYVLNELIEDAVEDTTVFLVDYALGETKVKRLEKSDLDEISEYGVDLFYNLDAYLKSKRGSDGTVDNA